MTITVERFTALRVIPVLRLSSLEKARTAIECLVEAGYGTVEVTLTTPGALKLISELKTEMGADFLVGAGTVLDEETARASIDAGADYLVSPCLVPGMASIARDAGALALSGGFTPAEVLAAWRDGASIVKVFPASTGGPVHLGALHAVYPKIPLCPTGGVSASNIMEYFRAGAAVVGVGNNIIDQKALSAGDRAGVIEHAGSFLEIAGSEDR
jgi:2-dehydro-3-deoxyphosphogluconate aldolase/(4S)-4-hydroxy-2-oxoglutarate aldolase